MTELLVVGLGKSFVVSSCLLLRTIIPSTGSPCGVAVHSGADLESAISNCMGYKSEGQGFMVGVEINLVSGLPSGFPDLLRFILAHVEDKNVEALLEGLLEVREELRPLLSNPNGRLKDLLFLDIALDSTVRTAIERGYEEI